MCAIIQGYRSKDVGQSSRFQKQGCGVVWVHNSRSRSKDVGWCGSIIQGSRSKDVGWCGSIIQGSRSKDVGWVHNSRFHKKGCRPIIQYSRGKDLGPSFNISEG